MRVASVIRLRPEHDEAYGSCIGRSGRSARRADPCARAEHSIFLRDGLLFSYLEYTGDD